LANVVVSAVEVTTGGLIAAGSALQLVIIPDKINKAKSVTEFL